METNRQQWLELRRQGIGGSDAAAVLGLSKWKTPYQVYQEKRGDLSSDIDNEPMLWGRAIEPVIRQQYAERTGRSVFLPNTIIKHPEHDFMLATIDGVTDDNRLIEIKTARTDIDWGEPGTDEIPHIYLIQVQHYLAVTGLSVADVAVLIGGQDYRQYEIAADKELQDLLVEAEADFWERVKCGEPPDPITVAEAMQRYRFSQPDTIEATNEIVDCLNSLKIVKTEIEDKQAWAEKLQTEIMAFMGSNEVLANESMPLCTWKQTAAPVRFDTEKFKAKQPELYPEYLKSGEPCRRFIIK